MSDQEGPKFEKDMPRDIVVRDTKEIVLKDVPTQLWLDYRDFSRKYAKGNWTLALQMMLLSANSVSIVAMLDEQIARLEARVDALEQRKDEPVRKAPKTFGGIKTKTPASGSTNIVNKTEVKE